MQKLESFYTSKGSTFRSKIYYTSGSIVTGYSKGKKFEEGSDKIVLLEKWINRLKDYGYFDPAKVKKIEFYLNKEGYENYLFLTVTPTEFILHNKNYFKDNRLERFLYAFYKNPSIKISSHVPKLINEDKIFDLSCKRFYTPTELINFCLDQVKNGFEKTRVIDFHNKYFNKYLSNPY